MPLTRTSAGAAILNAIDSARPNSPSRSFEQGLGPGRAHAKARSRSRHRALKPSKEISSATEADDTYYVEIQEGQERDTEANLKATAADKTGNEGVQQSLAAFVQGFVLPRGFPSSVTPDYLEYQMRCLPAHITGWMSKSLATSSLIHALNVGPVSPSGTVAASAAIKWITKDGIGAFGRFLVGGRLGGIFDEDPRRWRMIAVGFATVGLAFEIATTAFPANFIVLAGLGNFSKALGKGLSSPSFRIIQTHFALTKNVGEVSAKEEVWEVTAQLLGLAFSVSLLRLIEANGEPKAVLWIWVLIQVVHVYLRYAALRALQFEELNQKRASLLVQASVNQRPIPSVKEASTEEPILASSSGVSPNIRLGVGLQEVFPGSAHYRQEQAQGMQHIYRKQSYWLVWRDGKGQAMLSEGFHPSDVLKILWQGAWLDAEGVVDAQQEDLERSLVAMQGSWLEFERQIKDRGWDTQKQVYKLGPARIRQKRKHA